ncbi:ABC transporter permease [Streptomyces sp. NRRL S-813]|uniref:ABC transporter permease n=1 Tax=Streptomyces sp. NRRL S-813 TaxID=1463919 RepID=UPI0004C1AC0D|nr:ABC transporter permease [Streptomyces sp. NRRL S-813]
MNQLWTYFTAHQDQIVGWAQTTVWLATLPVAIGLALALPCGWLAYRHPAVRTLVTSGLGVLYTIPSLVMFLLIPEVLGTKILSPVNVVTALTLYTFTLLVRSVLDGLDSVPAPVLSTATAMGHTTWQRLLSVQLPLALPVIGAGLRVAAVSNVSLVSVASVIGTAQLGQLFLAGNNTGSLPPTVLGLMFFAAIALLLDLTVVAALRLLTPWRAVTR